jgi:hypothetical protein
MKEKVAPRDKKIKNQINGKHNIGSADKKK